MRTRIKICGLTHAEGVAAAVDAGADAVGFVLVTSPRQVSPERAAELARDIPPFVARVAVVRRPPAGLIERAADVLAPDWVQADVADLAALPAGARWRALPVVREGEPLPEPLPPWMVYEGPQSGRGQTVDWTRAGTLARCTRLILAGGLNPDNVGGAVRTVRPWGVDVSSGVERAPGDKDPARIAAFVAAVRAAEEDA